MKIWESYFKKPQKQRKNLETKQEDTSSNILTGNFTMNIELIQQEIGHNSDVHFHKFKIFETNATAVIIYIEGLADRETLDGILNGLKLGLVQHSSEQPIKSHLKDFIEKNTMTNYKIIEVTTIEDLITPVMAGAFALLIDGSSKGFIVGEGKGKVRNIEEPVSESLVRGPRIGFIENLYDNTALLRRYGKNRNLSIINFHVGERSKRELVIAYMQDVVDPNLVEEVKRRIAKINIDDTLESGYVEQLIEDNYLSPFPQVQSTERLDRVLSALFEGRVAILLDGTPFALIVPVTFNMFLQSPEDYYDRWLYGSMARFLRYFTSLVSLFVPALYIAFISFHQGLIPTRLAFSIAATRKGVPFPPIIEALIMEISIEVLREAGLRLPKPIGQTLGVVGGLIIGEAAVQAGIVSPIMVIIVALTAISSFTLPQYNIGMALRMLRFVAMLFAAVFGLYGIILFFFLLLSHLVKLESFGVPYLSPAAPYRLSDWKDFMLRLPLFMMKRRPKLLQTKDNIRKGNDKERI
ncbi:spore germination protein [Bacillus cereus]|uniref:spore germination protein n=1 Tax=Bacillus cereus TaxID=1396 RepID=UPI002AC2FE9E|nr:spore germination protein [Bacillus cereus]MDZ4406740.1 spore germination protein [Bacillus cereus]MDZ4533976.1 spore germination protein [Bacillus cereus]